MNEQANEILAKLMQRALDGVDSAVEFSQQQIPDIVQQLLTWKAIESGISMLVFVAIIIGMLIGWRKVIKFVKNYDTDDSEEIGAIYGLSVLASVIIILISSCFFDLVWLKIWLAPKLYLLEYGASLIK